MRHTWIAFVALVAGLALANPAGPRATDTTRPAALRQQSGAPALAAGTLLVAARRLRDPAFQEAVVLLFAFSPHDGAAGLIVNRRSEVPVRRLLPDLPVARGALPTAFIGGPVSQQEVRGLWRWPLLGANVVRPLPDVVLLGSPAAIDQAVTDGASAERMRLYLGYAGWSPGQLEREIARGDWHIMKGDSAIVFAPDPDAVWRRQIRLTDVLAV